MSRKSVPDDVKAAMGASNGRLKPTPMLNRAAKGLPHVPDDLKKNQTQTPPNVEPTKSPPTDVSEAKKEGTPLPEKKTSPNEQLAETSEISNPLVTVPVASVPITQTKSETVVEPEINKDSVNKKTKPENEPQLKPKQETKSEKIQVARKKLQSTTKPASSTKQTRTSDKTKQKATKAFVEPKTKVEQPKKAAEDVIIDIEEPPAQTAGPENPLITEPQTSTEKEKKPSPPPRVDVINEPSSSEMLFNLRPPPAHPVDPVKATPLHLSTPSPQSSPLLNKANSKKQPIKRSPVGRVMNDKKQPVRQSPEKIGTNNEPVPVERIGVARNANISSTAPQTMPSVENVVDTQAHTSSGSEHAHDSTPESDRKATEHDDVSYSDTFSSETDIEIASPKPPKPFIHVFEENDIFKKIPIRHDVSSFLNHGAPPEPQPERPPKSSKSTFESRRSAAASRLLSSSYGTRPMETVKAYNPVAEKRAHEDPKVKEMRQREHEREMAEIEQMRTARLNTMSSIYKKAPKSSGK